jgi:predicted RNase H-like nuclease (RuvC/YqgF family)
MAQDSNSGPARVVGLNAELKGPSERPNVNPKKSGGATVGAHTEDQKLVSSVNPLTPSDNTSTRSSTAENSSVNCEKLMSNLQLEMKAMRETFREKIETLNKGQKQQSIEVHNYYDKLYSEVNQLKREQSILMKKIAKLEKEKSEDKITIERLHNELIEKVKQEQEKDKELMRLRKELQKEKKSNRKTVNALTEFVRSLTNNGSGKYSGADAY